MHRKRVLGDKSVDDAARAAAYSRGNRIKLSQVTTAAHYAPTYSAYLHPLPLQVLRQFPSAHDGRKIRCAPSPTASAVLLVTRPYSFCPAFQCRREVRHGNRRVAREMQVWM